MKRTKKKPTEERSALDADALSAMTAWGEHANACAECTKFREGTLATPCFLGLLVVMRLARLLARVSLASRGD